MDMKYLVLAGSPRKNSNTNSLVEVIGERLKEYGNEVSAIQLYGKKISGCTACLNCQKDWNSFGCEIPDDMQEIFDAVLESDHIILATPIYSWSCPAPMKAVLDRLVYGMNKYYGEAKGPSLWEGKKLSIVVTCGYPIEKGADLFEEMIKRYCKHSKLVYCGMYAERHMVYKTVFMDEGKVKRAKKFADSMVYGNLT